MKMNGFILILCTLGFSAVAACGSGVGSSGAGGSGGESSTGTQMHPWEDAWVEPLEGGLDNPKNEDGGCPFLPCEDQTVECACQSKCTNKLTCPLPDDAGAFVATCDTIPDGGNCVVWQPMQ